ncbi:MAG: hypothetical protein ABFD89_12595 [Bryobacteraceae bacterium]
MCDCEKPTRNDEDRRFGIEGRAPVLSEGDTLIYDECGRCAPKPQVKGRNSIDFHSHHFRLVKRDYGEICLLVRHGGGDERVKLGYSYTCIPELLEPMDSDGRYLMLHALYAAHYDAARQAREQEAAKWQQAAADKRIKTRRMPKQGYVKVWIEPARKGKE